MSTFAEIFKRMTEGYPPEEKQRGTVEVEPYYTCGYCHEHVESVEDLDTDGLCVNCAKDKARGYRIRQLCGRLANGAERDRGRLWHAVPQDSWTALCGQKPGRRSGGWSSWLGSDVVTCPRCLRKIRNQEE